MSGPDLVESLLSVIGSEQLEFSFKDAGEEPQHVRVVLDQEHGAEPLVTVLRLFIADSRCHHSFFVVGILQGRGSRLHLQRSGERGPAPRFRFHFYHSTMGFNQTFGHGEAYAPSL